MRRGKSLIASIIVILIIVSVLVPFINTYSAEASNTSENNGNEERLVDAARKLIEHTSDKIQRLLSLADTYGIAIPNNLLKMDEVNGLLENASHIVDSNPREAAKISVQAMIVFSPAARYIISNLPEDVVNKGKRRGLSQAIDVKLRMLNNLNNTMEWMKNMSINIPLETETDIGNARTILIEANETLSSGNYNASDIAHMIANASKLIGHAMSQIHRSSAKKWVAASLAESSLKQIGGLTKMMSNTLNKTVESIESGDVSEAEHTLSILMNRTGRIIEFLNKSIDISIRKTGESSGYTVTLTSLYNAFLNASVHMENALEELNYNNTFVAERELEIALSAINNAVNNIGPEVKGLYIHANRLRNAIEGMKKNMNSKMKNIFKHRTEKISMNLHKMEKNLHVSYQLYKRGKLSQEKFIHILNTSEHTLKSLINNLNSLPNPPKHIINEANALLSWIENVKNEIGQS